jgi:hypothetical protein
MDLNIYDKKSGKNIVQLAISNLNNHKYFTKLFLSQALTLI